MQNIFSGLEWDARLEDKLYNYTDHMDSIEVIPENFFYRGKIQLNESMEKLRETKKPILFHGVELSIGGYEPLKENHLANMMRLMDILHPTAYSEHLSMTEAAGIEIGQLTPLLWSNDLADIISEKIIVIQKKIGIPFLIENISNRFVLPYTEIMETDFINRILRNTNCGLLLDITNVFTNSYNHKFDPYQWINSIDLSFVSEIHLAGGTLDHDKVLQDSHDEAIWDESWQLYRYIIEKIGPCHTIIERTGNIPQFDCLIEEIERARNIQKSSALKKLAI